MFTGLVEEIGRIKAIRKGAKSMQMTISANKIMSDIKIGDSIAVNGICLTATSFDENSFTADVMPETMKSSNLNTQKVGSQVNLERALKLSDRLGGHIVSGHIDGVGKVVAIQHEDNAILISITAPEHILKYIIRKGSITVDGISLTVAFADEHTFKVSIIPLTQQDTTLTSKKTGEKVNLECDITAKYIEKFMIYNNQIKKTSKSEITIDYLRENGFM